MSSVSIMEELLDGVEVEWKALGEIAIVQRGASPRPIAQFITDDDDGVPWIKIGDTESGSKYVQKTAQNITKEGAKKSRVLNKGDFIISNSMSFGRPYILNITGAIHDGWASISGFRDKLNSDFLYHYLASKSVQDYWLSKINSGSVSNLNADIIKTLLVPIPCPENPKKSLEIQAEIVRILDTFTELTAELTAELSMRKKQYNYYRDQLLSFEEGEVEWKTLGEVAVIGTGSHDTQDAIQDGDYIFYARGREPLSLNVFDFDETAIITAGDGAGVGKVFHYAQGKYALHQRAYRIVPSEMMNPRFVYHCLRSYFYEYIQKASVSSSVTSLRRPMFLNFPIPVPPLAEQARIVAILDKFDALTNSITEGLPREIELRQKQYEYYRDLLLSFPKPDEQAA
jgi:type I restriction enzyme S subunit